MLRDDVKLTIINTVRSKNRAEIFRCKIARRHFLLCVVGDPRTRAQFQQWRRESKLDAMAAAWATELEDAALAAGLPDRSSLRQNEAVYNALPIVTRRRLGEYDRLLTAAKRETADARADAVMAFIGRVLFPNPPPLQWWLGFGLLNYFDAELVRDLWGESEVAMEIVVGTLDQVPLERGQKPNSAIIERDVDWYYQHHVADPKISTYTIARARDARREVDGSFRAATGQRGIKEIPDKREITLRIKEADRLLNGLVIPPEQVIALLKVSRIQA